MNCRFLPLTFLCVLFAFGSNLHAGNWPNWRGPNYDGTISDSNLPAKFSQTENVKWKVEMPGMGASTPIIWEDHVFVTSGDDATGESVGMAFDRKTGKELWRRPVVSDLQRQGLNNRSTYASPSPVTDGELVVFFFGSGDLAAFDFEGNQLWAKNIIKQDGGFGFGWTFSSSPVLHKDRLYMQLLQRNQTVSGSPGGPSYLLAMDPKTGNELFRQNRPSEAVMESLEAFTTPTPFTHNGREELLIVGGDSLTGHDLTTGEELWRWGTWNPGKEPFWRLVPSPVGGDGVILACAPKKNPVYAVKAGLEGTHTDDSVLAWVSDPKKPVAVSTDVSTPAYLDGRFYILNSDFKTLACVEAKTGKVIYSEQLDSKAKLESSPTIADGKIYMMNHIGDVFVVKAGDEFELLHVAEMGTGGERDNRSTISVSQGNLFIRTNAHLFCVGL